MGSLPVLGISCTVLRNYLTWKDIAAWFLAKERRLALLWRNSRAKEVISPLALNWCDKHFCGIEY